MEPKNNLAPKRRHLKSDWLIHSQTLSRLIKNGTICNLIGSSTHKLDHGSSKWYYLQYDWLIYSITQPQMLFSDVFL